MPLTRVTCNVQDASQMTGYAFSSTGDSLSNRLTCLGQSCTCWQWFVDFLPKRRPRLDFVHCATPCWLWVSFKQHCVSCLLCPLHKKNVFKGTGILLIMGQSLCVPCIPWEKYEANGLRKICCALPTWMKNTWVSTVFVRLERNCNIQSDRWCLLWDMGGSVYKDDICRKKCEGQNWWAKLWPAFFS